MAMAERVTRQRPSPEALLDIARRAEDRREHPARRVVVRRVGLEQQ